MVGTWHRLAFLDPTSGVVYHGVRGQDSDFELEDASLSLPLTAV